MKRPSTSLYSLLFLTRRIACMEMTWGRESVFSPRTAVHETKRHATCEAVLLAATQDRLGWNPSLVGYSWLAVAYGSWFSIVSLDYLTESDAEFADFYEKHGFWCGKQVIPGMVHSHLSHWHLMLQSPGEDIYLCEATFWFRFLRLCSSAHLKQC